MKRLVSLLIAGLIALSGLALTLAQGGKKMHTYVLVHGSWMGQFAWDEIKPRLEKDGHTVITLDLPAHGNDPTPANQASLEGYRDAVIKAIGNRTDVILVGHSFGGMVISSVAEAIPGRLSKLVFIAAYLPRNGESVLTLSNEDKNSLVGKYWSEADPKNYSPVSINAEGIVETFCADCPDKYKKMLLERHREEPVPPFATPITLTAPNYGSVARYYVQTMKDNTVSTQLQELMLSRVSMQRVFKLETSHSPFFSVPDQLATILTTL